MKRYSLTEVIGGCFALCFLLIALRGTFWNTAKAAPRPPVPLEVIDPAAKTYSIRTDGSFKDYLHVKDPVLGVRGQLTFTQNGKEIVIGPSVRWIATEE